MELDIEIEPSIEGGFSNSSLAPLCRLVAGGTRQIAYLLWMMSKRFSIVHLLENSPSRDQKHQTELILGFYDLHNSAMHVHERAASLHRMLSLSASSGTADWMWPLLARTLSMGESANERLHDQVLRVKPGNLSAVNVSYCCRWSSFLEAYGKALGYFDRTLRLEREEQQDAIFRQEECQMVLYQISPEGYGLDLETGILHDISNLEQLEQQAGEPNLHLARDPSSSSTPTAETRTIAPVGSASLLASFARLLAMFVPKFTPKPHPYVCALCQAILLRDFSRTRALIILGTNVTGRDNSGRTPMQCAIQADYPEAAALLLVAGVTLKAPDWGNPPPLFQAASVGSLRVAELLLEHGADPSARNVWGQRYFVYVCLSENIAGVDFLLHAGANAMWETSSGRPVLISAVEKGNADLVQLLLRHGAKATCRDVNGSSVLALATEKNDLVITRILLDAGAEVDSSSLCDMTLLADALSRGHIHIAQLLLEHGAQANTNDVYGRPLLISVIKDSRFSADEKTNLVRQLLENGADANAKDGTAGVSTINYALEEKLPVIVDLLYKYGARRGEL